HGLDTDLATLRRRFSMSLKGVTLVELVRMADALQLASRPLRAELGQIEHLRTPCVLHWDMNHFVVLVSVRRGVALIHDPAHGERRLKMAELSPHFTGVALELQPMPGFAPRQERQAVRWRELMGPVGGLGRALTQIFVLALALEAFVLLSPYFMQWVVDDVLVSANRDLLITLGIGFGLLVLIQTATSTARSWAVLALSASLNLQWLLNVFTHLLRLPIAWFEKHHPGDILSRFGAVQQIQQALTTSFIEALLDGAMVALTLVVMAVYSMPLTALAVGTVLAYALLRLALLRQLRQASAEALIHESRQTSHFLESLHGITAIKLFSAQADRHARFSTLVVETMNADFATRKLELVVTVGNRLLFGLERVAVIWLGAVFVLEQRMSVGMLFAFFAYREQFVLRFSGLIDKAVALRLLRLQGDRLADIVLTAPEVETALEAPAVVQQPSIELVDVSFRYADGEPDVLSHVSLHIEAGESVAIVGPSGCGKTTLLKVMLGILRPSSGEVRIGGVALSRMGLARARTLVGAVMQDEPLFSGSVADNIAFFDPEPERARIEQCAR
ncbi:MAG TPA: peptidase domain-containing ABC transporter, partial [Burkholderiaceae bacterium]|nr:peptidase domain-containing ABC transporter [Burkholderiaceae bacterium]